MSSKKRSVSAPTVGDRSPRSTDDSIALNRSLTAGLLTVWLIRTFTVDLAEHLAVPIMVESFNPTRLDPGSREYQRYMGVVIPGRAVHGGHRAVGGAVDDPKATMALFQ